MQGTNPLLRVCLMICLSNKINFFYHSFADYSVLGVEGSRGISKSDMLKIFFVIYHALPITLALC